ncbi:KxYKxGKxW signal peptide domain-containing protein [Secundilactobacillus paracollinoides]|uniref:KxYKxGKxW signal peptide domain-containing protein n=1 Tax=Secundilactobacillus paracollinoides TaxID=240427 RepID=UPI0006D1CCFD|nr:KxYKxGKxW signal peptide domain-containing protein [Secundilactobacillus paracollinoides]
MQATTERKHHVKLYKAGKLWLAAGITTAAMGIAAISGGVVANADSTGEPASGETTSVTNDSDLTVTKSLTLNSASSPEDSQADPVSNGNETPDPDGNAAQEGTGSEQSQSEQLEQGNTDTGQSDPDEPGTPGQGDKAESTRKQ